MKTIYLVGFMGAGKSHVGRKLGKFLNCGFVDLDTRIEQASGKAIKGIFATQGEAYFRLLERQALHNTRFDPSCVVATGGGTACFYNNMQWMNENGTCIFLDATLPILAQRLWKGRIKRPILNGLTKQELPHFIEAKLQDRRSYYQQAGVHYLIHQPEQDSAAELYRQLNNIIGH